MAERGLGDDSTLLDLPWAAVFDPAANARALGAVQSQGLRAATELVDRFVTVFAEGESSGSRDDSDDNATATTRNAAPDARVDGLFSAWQNLISKITPTAGTSNAAAGGVATLDVVGGLPANTVHLTVTGAGAAHTEVWLHNGGPDDLGEVRLRSSELLGHTGHSIAAAQVTFDRRSVPLPPRTSVGTVVTVQVPDGTPPGVYRGTLLVDDHPDLWLSMMLTVRE
ncbi:hypothetical protein Q2100_18100 [Mycolicibacterium sp. KC 300]|uniref:Uncharacterized protein n=1 Tax=Mycolicibacterium arseniciresistens TaxID=3062257 RepID=A0ABT8UIL8_9MYCO|nr:hypothetical protein [Mycolicibacterium arseniciresistens]